MTTLAFRLPVQSRADGSLVGGPYTPPANIQTVEIILTGTGYTLQSQQIGMAVFRAPAGSSTTLLPCTTDPSTDTITCNGHGLANNAPIQFQNDYGTLPAPLQAGVTYFVRNRTTNTFKVALTSGGTALDLTTAGTGYTQIAQDWAPETGFAVEVGHGGVLISSVDMAANTLAIRHHGLSEGASFQLQTLGTLPAPLQPGVPYFVHVVDASTIQLALTSGGAAIDLTDGGTGESRLIAPFTPGFVVDPGQGRYTGWLISKGGPISFGVDFWTEP